MLAQVEALAHANSAAAAAAERCFVTLTYAQSLDGCIALKKQASTPLLLSSPASMLLTHQLRAFHDGILVGVGTVLLDNPSLTTRLCPGADPRPVVLDTELRVPLDCKLLLNARANKCIVVCKDLRDAARVSALEALGASVIACADLNTLFQRLKQEFGIQRLMAEGGARVINSLMRPENVGLVDCVLLTIAPIFLGQSGLSPTQVNAGQAVFPSFPRVKILCSDNLGGDLVFVGVFSQAQE